MPTWGTVLAPAQIEDLVALLAAWRQGQEVLPAYSLPDLLDLALFALSQGDVASASLHVARAVTISTGPTAEALRQVEAQIGAGDLSTVEQALLDLKENRLPAGGSSAQAGGG
jgi:hypothetical protein